MTTASAHARDDDAPPAPAPRPGAALQRMAAVVLLCIVAGRAFVAELPFRTALLDLPPGSTAQTDAPSPTRADRGELARVTFSCLLLADMTLWLVGAALAGRLVLRHGKLAALIGVFAVLSLASVFVASDKRGALDGWVEQLAMMAACFLAAQSLADRRGLRLTAAALAAVGVVLAAKGVHQVLVEIPQTAAYLETYGKPPGLTGAAERAFAARVRGTTPTGFWGLSNPLASLLVLCLLAAAGLAVDKCRRAIRDRRVWREQRSKGEVHLPALAATATCLMAAGVAAVLALTRSRGGILAAAMVLVAWAVVWRWRAALSARWRGATAVVLVAFLIGCACVIGYGLAKDRLPSKTMTFRWHYWTGAAAIVADHPLLGVGPGNFASAYLRYRRPGAEEAVKLPHNVVAEAASQYGLTGGAAYLAVVLFVLLGACRPAAPVTTAVGGNGRAGRLALAMAAAVVGGRWLFSESGAYPMLLLLDGMVPAALLAGAVLVAAWWGRSAGGQDAPAGGLRAALAGGVVAVFLHSMVEFSLFMAGAATAFWTVAGACLGATGRGRGRDLSPLRWVLAGNALVVTAAAVAVFWWPVYCRTTLTEAAMAAWANHDAAATAEFAERAARSDPLDGFAAADAARAAMAGVGGEDWTSASAALTAARGWADQATRRDPAYYGHFTLASDLAWLLAARDNYTYCWDMLPPAIHGEEVPMDQRVVALAAMAKHAYEGGHYSGAVALLERAVQRDPESAMLQGYLGDAAWMAGQVQAAQAAWRRADELAPRGGAVDDALACPARAAQRNPTDPRLRLTAAAMYARAARPADCNTELDAAERLDAALNPESLLHFDAAEQTQVRLLRARAAVPAAAGGT